ncbi:unnamed protein product [Malus baccata var. baccata]
MTINDKRESEDDKIIKQQNGKSRGFAFVTRDSGEGAQAAIDKFHSHDRWKGCYGVLGVLGS